MSHSNCLAIVKAEPTAIVRANPKVSNQAVIIVQQAIDYARYIAKKRIAIAEDSDYGIIDQTVGIGDDVRGERS